MKIGLMEHIALNSGPVGYWFTVLWASILVGIGGTLIGAILSGIIGKLTNIDIEAGGFGISVIFGTAILFAFFGGFYCRRRLNQLKKNMTKQGRSGEFDG